MNRTDRLYALVEELCAVSPRPRSSHWLARRFSVTERTIRRDVETLQQAGVPIYAEPGRRGGYIVDKTHTLPPINITAREAVAAAVALSGLSGAPLLSAARSVLHKVIAAMGQREFAAACDFAGRIHVVGDTAAAGAPTPEVLRAAEDALARRQVLTIDYVDRHETSSRRSVEPVGLLRAGPQWHLMGWCRLRDDLRDFRLDRVRRAVLTQETAGHRFVAIEKLAVYDAPVFRFGFPENADTMVS